MKVNKSMLVLKIMTALLMFSPCAKWFMFVLFNFHYSSIIAVILIFPFHMLGNEVSERLITLLEISYLKFG